MKNLNVVISDESYQIISHYMEIKKLKNLHEAVDGLVAETSRLLEKGDADE